MNFPFSNTVEKERQAEFDWSIIYFVRVLWKVIEHSSLSLKMDYTNSSSLCFGPQLSHLVLWSDVTAPIKLVSCSIRGFPTFSINSKLNQIEITLKIWLPLNIKCTETAFCSYCIVMRHLTELFPFWAKLNIWYQPLVLGLIGLDLIICSLLVLLSVRCMLTADFATCPCKSFVAPHTLLYVWPYVCNESNPLSLILYLPGPVRFHMMCLIHILLMRHPCGFTTTLISLPAIFSFFK